MSRQVVIESDERRLSVKKLLILDKDGTLTRPKSGGKWVTAPDDQELIPGVTEALDYYRKDGWLLAMASNQGGVASGKKTLLDAIAEAHYAMALCRIGQGMIAHSYESNYGEAISLSMDIKEASWPPHLENHWNPVVQKSERFRKPGPGMIRYLARSASGLMMWQDKMDVLFVGDSIDDEGAALAAGAEFKWDSDWRNLQ